MLSRLFAALPRLKRHSNAMQQPYDDAGVYPPDPVADEAEQEQRGPQDVEDLPVAEISVEPVLGEPVFADLVESARERGMHQRLNADLRRRLAQLNAELVRIDARQFHDAEVQ